MRGLADCMQQMRYKLRQYLPSLLAPDGAVASMVPSANSGRDFLRLLKPHALDGCQRFRIVFHACKTRFPGPARLGDSVNKLAYSFLTCPVCLSRSARSKAG